MKIWRMGKIRGQGRQGLHTGRREIELRITHRNLSGFQGEFQDEPGEKE